MDPLHVKRQIEALKRIRHEIVRGEHVGAGLALSIRVGGGEESQPIVLTLGTDTGPVLEAIRDALERTLSLSRSIGKSEIARMQEALEELESHIPTGTD